MEKFEYMEICEKPGREHFRGFMDELNRLGKERWELVTIIAYGPDNYHEAYLKRTLAD